MALMISAAFGNFLGKTIPQAVIQKTRGLGAVKADDAKTQDSDHPSQELPKAGI
jgi:hypothetical protein